MHMLLIPYILLIKPIQADFLLAMAGFQQLEEVPQELLGVGFDVLFGVFADEQHGAHVPFGLRVLFEAVLVAALFFADLAVPAEALEAFGFHFVGDVFGAADFGFWHDGGVDAGGDSS